MSLYPKLTPEKNAILVNTQEEKLSLACCDCGSVHYVEIIKQEDGKIMVTFKSNHRSTAQLRRHKYGYLQEEKCREKYRLVRLKT